jgi:hypothetical protein
MTGGFYYFVEILEALVIGIKSLFCETGKTLNHLQNVVELMRDTAGQRSNRFQPLFLFHDDSVPFDPAFSGDSGRSVQTTAEPSRGKRQVIQQGQTNAASGPPCPEAARI